MPRKSRYTHRRSILPSIKKPPSSNIERTMACKRRGTNEKTRLRLLLCGSIALAFEGASRCRF